jgi:hypothetical protein
MQNILCLILLFFTPLFVWSKAQKQKPLKNSSQSKSRHLVFNACPLDPFMLMQGSYGSEILKSSDKALDLKLQVVLNFGKNYSFPATYRIVDKSCSPITGGDMIEFSKATIVPIVVNGVKVGAMCSYDIYKNKVQCPGSSVSYELPLSKLDQYTSGVCYILPNNLIGCKKASR